MLAKGINTSACSAADLGDLLVGDAGMAHLRLAIDRENHRADVALPVILRDLRNRRRDRGLEILRHGFIENDGARIAGLALRQVGVGVDVDRDQLVEIQFCLVLGHE